MHFTTTQRERLIELMIEAKRTEPDDVKVSEWLADVLLGNGVTVPIDCSCGICSRHVPPGANYCWKCGRPLR